MYKKNRRRLPAVPLKSVAALATAGIVAIVIPTAAGGVIAAPGLRRAAATTAAVRTIHLGREEFVDRELKVREYSAGILCFAGTAVRAVAARHADVVRWHEQLDIALQTDDRKLSQRYKQLIALVVKNDVVAAEAAAQRVRNLAQAAAAAIARCLGRHNAGIEQDRINDFDDRLRQVALGAKLNIHAVFHIAGREDAGAALAAEQDDALVKYRQSVDNARTANRAADLDFDLVEEADIYRVKTAVELHALNVDLNAKQLGAAGLDGGNTAAVEQFLTLAAQVNADVAQAFLALAGIVNFIGVNADSFAEAAGGRVIRATAADRAGATDFISHVYLPPNSD